MVVFLVLITNTLLSFNFVQGDSMHSTLKDGDFVLSERVSVCTRSLRRGDIVIADPNTSPVLVIKRVIGIPGDTISFAAGVFTLNGDILDEDYIIDNITERIPVSISELKLGEGEYFIVGDNRNFSYDSLDYGPVHIRNIRAKVILHLGI